MQAGLSWVRANAERLKIAPTFFKKNDLHLHVPAGAVPKDGPSAGVTVITALVSLLTGRRVKPNYAMTGEVTLTGLVLPVGGVKEKVLAARRTGVTDVILPRENEVNVNEDLNPDQIGNLNIHYVREVEEVIGLALVDPAGEGHEHQAKREARAEETAEPAAVSARIRTSVK